MTDDEKKQKILKQTFTTPEGKQALEILRDMSKYDTATNFKKDSLLQAYQLGAANLFKQIIETIKK